MKHYFVVVLLFALFSLTFGQTPSPSPTPSASPENSRTRDFGSSLKKYENTTRQNSGDKQKLTEPDKERDDDGIIRVETELVVHDVLVTDPKGNVITGLNKGDFVVTEDGVPQSIEVFSSDTRSTIPRSIVLIIDCDLLQMPYLKLSTEAAKTLVDKLGPQDNMAIVTTDAILQLDFTADKMLLKQTLDYVEKKGREYALWYGRGAKLEELDEKTREEASKRGKRWQFDTLMAVLNEMFDEQGRQRIVLFQGDGVAVIWLKPDKDLPYPVSHSTRMNSGGKYTPRNKWMSNIGFSDVKEAIESSRATIYSVATGIRFFGLPEKERMARAKISFENMEKAHGWKNDYPPAERRMYVDREAKVRTAGQAAMYRVAELSGGNTAIMEKPEDAERIYSDIFAVINNRYVMGYYPTDSKKGEKRRSVKIEVRAQSEYNITARKTYILQ